MASRLGRFLQRALLVVSSVVIAVSLTVLGTFLFNPRLAEEFTSGLRPTLFQSELPTDLLDPALEDRYGEIFGIAHNSGDSVSATLTALAGGADAIEIDVVSLDGKLYSSHASPLPLIGRGVFRGPSLEMIWAAAVQTDVVKFDLKETSPEYRELVLRFLSTRRREHQVIVASPDAATLRFFADRMPEVIRLYSVGNAGELEKLQNDPALAAMVNGVSIRQSLVDEESAAWLNAHELVMVAWTVNDLGRANELIRLGVVAITTDNLALLGLFGGQRRGEETLEQDTATPSPATPVPAETGLALPVNIPDSRWPAPWPRRRGDRLRTSTGRRTSCCAGPPARYPPGGARARPAARPAGRPAAAGR